jgi:hypothetical protein
VPNIGDVTTRKTVALIAAFRPVEAITRFERHLYCMRSFSCCFPFTLPITANHCQSLPITANHCQSLPITANHCQSLPITANHCPPLSTTAKYSESLPFTVEILLCVENLTRGTAGSRLSQHRPSIPHCLWLDHVEGFSQDGTPVSV